MSAREQALALLRVAGYHGDQRAWMRTYTERRISYPVARKVWAEGQRARASGAKCTCVGCVAGEPECDDCEDTGRVECDEGTTFCWCSAGDVAEDDFSERNGYPRLRGTKRGES